MGGGVRKAFLLGKRVQSIVWPTGSRNAPPVWTNQLIPRRMWARVLKKIANKKGIPPTTQEGI